MGWGVASWQEWALLRTQLDGLTPPHAALLVSVPAGPIVGGFAGEALGWRWVFWLMTMFTGALTVVALALMPETYAPVLLRRRVAAVAKAAAAPAAAAAATAAATAPSSPPSPPPPAAVYRSKFDAKGVQPLPVLLATSLTRPWLLLFREPIVMLLSLYTAIVYGVLYMLFAAFPIVYQRGYGWSPGVGGERQSGIWGRGWRGNGLKGRGGEGTAEDGEGESDW